MKELSSKDLNHLGLVSRICNEIGLVAIISSQRQKQLFILSKPSQRAPVRKCNVTEKSTSHYLPSEQPQKKFEKQYL